ncbi:unnamed protein product [Psylliodes chrysocephalus]|uniref:Uncharacterized protein n=1 Tax=Psylliodes chrysocephalus TaxID=3402493 RepID=A0A9P0CU48_9CUCU|nr:unnamed protein product [Psylliodes chrysocephala]
MEQLDRLIQQADQEILEAKLRSKSCLITNIDRVWERSQASFITEEGAQMLALPKKRIEAEIAGLAHGQPKLSKWRIQAHLKPRFSSNFAMNVQLMVMSKLTQAIPKNSLLHVDTATLQNLLADPTFNKTGPIDLLLGAEEYMKSCFQLQ